MIQLTKKGIIGAVDIDALREEYRSLSTFRMRQLIHPDLMQNLWRRLEETSWKIREHEKIGDELEPDDGIPESILYFVANVPAFLDVIGRITECDEITGYVGRIYRFADSGQYDSWHDDVSGSSRRVGMSVNLSREPYEGGLFRIRRRGSAEIIRELPNTIPGDAIFFRISTDLQHIVTPVEGNVPKTAFAGWFGANSGFRELCTKSSGISGTTTDRDRRR